ncbi:MAG: hypothetical protein QCI38_00375 [Candidatus Thermoplasmatota archaeon]|nr:hypothetical protein [Candidatus Thermoplasmatota archaeon]
MEENFGLREINQIFREEKKNKPLTKIPGNFYSECQEYISSLETDIKEEEKKGGQTPNLMMLREEMGKAKDFIGRIYEERQRKILIAAHNKVRGAQVDMDILTKEEREFFETLIDIMKESREAVLGSSPLGKKRLRELFTRRTKRSGAEHEEKSVSAEETVKHQTPPVQGKIDSAGAEHRDKGNAPTAEDKVVSNMATVLVLEDIPSLMGPDSIYELSSQDIVTLPLQMAELLQKQGKVRLINEN